MIGLVQLKRMIQLIIIILCSLFLCYGNAFARMSGPATTIDYTLPAHLLENGR